MDKDSMQLIGIRDVMAMLGVGRPTATWLLQQEDCPTLPRVKGAPYLVEKEAFTRWLIERKR